jgi:beta-glucosidase
MTANKTPDYKNPDLPIDQRVDDLIGRMTIEEKVSQMSHEAAAIERLDVPKYNWWNEALHGVARAGRATVFPQAIAMAASFHPKLLKRVARAISDEGRAKYHEAIRMDNRQQYLGLTYWSPNINIFRDPRWGRGHETYGECPYLTARMGVAFVRGLQGNDPTYLKSAACAKHFAVHSGPEDDRHHFDAVVSQRDLRETYLPAFEALVREAKVESVMGAYNRTNGEVCCASPTLLGQILRQEWGFAGHVMSDCWAILDFHEHHKVTKTPAESAALAVKNGCDLNCGCTYPHLLSAYKAGLIDEETIDVSLKRLFRTRMKLGMFDPDEKVPYAGIPAKVVGRRKHRRLALRMARESIVLLKNDDVLPLRRDLKRIFVVGPNATGVDVLQSNYYGFAGQYIAPLDGIMAAASVGTQVIYRQGCQLSGKDTSDFDNCLNEAKAADVTIAFMGLTAKLEGEEGDAVDSDAGGDRAAISLPGVQEDLLKKLAESGKPVILVLTSGSSVELNWAAENLPAILQAWYPGEQGGRAIADVLFGRHNPAGRLPVTFYKSIDDLPDFTNYDMAGRTYRFFDGQVLWPFGYGLSYTTFAYDNLRLENETIQPGRALRMAVDVTNTGDRPGAEVVQAYVRHVEAPVPVPLRQLAAFARVKIKPGRTRTVKLQIQPEQMQCYGDDGTARLEPGRFELSVGGGQPTDPAAGAVTTDFEVAGG